MCGRYRTSNEVIFYNTMKRDIHRENNTIYSILERDKMQITIRNDKYETILRLHTDEKQNLTIETVPSRRKAKISEVYRDGDDICYQIDVSVPEEIVQQISNDVLLNELRRRMVTW